MVTGDKAAVTGGIELCEYPLQPRELYGGDATVPREHVGLALVLCQEGERLRHLPRPLRARNLVEMRLQVRGDRIDNHHNEYDSTCREKVDWHTPAMPSCLRRCE